jgi:hypothetical protein
MLVKENNMITSRLRIFVNSCLLAAAASACSQGPVTIGDNQTTQLKTGLAAYAANWDGYAEANKFIDGTDAVRISVSEDGTGMIRFGDHDLWPAASDPNAVYPPDFAIGAIPSACPPLAVAWDGFLHPLKNLRIAQERLQAAAASAAIFATWCSLQKPISVGPGAYACIDSTTWIPGYGPTCAGSTDVDGGTSVCGAYRWTNAQNTTYELLMLPCEPAALCTAHNAQGNTGALNDIVVCTCTESGCQLGTILNDIVLDVALDSEQKNMVGTLALAGTNYTIRLKRQ